MERVKSIWTGFFCLFGSYYLTWCVNKITLETLFHKIFVFIYFLILLGLLSALRHRYLKSANMMVLNKSVKVILSIIMTAVIFVSGFHVFIGKYQPTHIFITAIGQTGQTHSEQKGTEVWITSIALDGQSYELSKIPLVPGWENRDNSLLSYQNQPSTLEFELPGAENIEINFLSHPWSGEVVVDGINGRQKIDLYQTEEQEKTVTIVLAGEESQPTWWNILAMIGCFIFLAGLVNTFVCMIKKMLVQKCVLFTFITFFLMFLPFELEGVTFIALIVLNASISMYLPEKFTDARGLP